VSRVLQHVPVHEGLDVLRGLARRLTDEGFLYLNLPFRTTRSLASRSVLSLRERVGVANAVVNRMKKRPAHVPVLQAVIYPLDEVIAALNESGCDVVRLDVESEGELTAAHLLVRKGGGQAILPARTGQFAGPPPEHSEDLIDPRDLIARSSIDELNALAEAYFSKMDVTDPQVAKPFSNPADAPAMLVSLGVLFEGAQLVSGMTVLDFGGGTGWLSRFLLQFGCDVILCDVSPSALRIAQQLVERHPPAGNRVGKLRVALFDGQRIDVEDASVDRILCFDSFHHVPNVEATLAEFARVLKPGALAAFSEPGPHHSRSAQSQFEMRVYGVLENDVDVPSIWQSARRAGFEELKLTAFNGNPAFVTLQEFDELLNGGPALQNAARAMRDFTSNVRTFTLRKAGVEQRDSRFAKGLSSDIQVEISQPVRANEAIPFTAKLTNTGTAAWLPSDDDPGGVSLGAHLYRDGVLADFDFLWTPIGTTPVQPNQEVAVAGTIRALDPGVYVLEFDCVAKSVAWFGQVGSKTTSITLTVA
ncbi:MAG TPA: class I SAM-dependent methyltransferase, partial [Thermoanaerobaculia bacterium]|nr:class I SAM-dependent methyltransferase [Thermoanaerobaculia bacterium]